MQKIVNRLQILMLSLCSLFIFNICFAQNNNWNNTVTPEITLEAIKIFRENPVGQDAQGALSLIVNFAMEYPNVSINVRPEHLPWEQGTLVPQLEGILLGAFVAGNIEYQLTNKVKENRPLEGIRLMLFSYQMLKNRSKVAKMEKFEKWIDLDSSNRLKSELKL